MGMHDEESVEARRNGRTASEETPETAEGERVGAHSAASHGAPRNGQLDDQWAEVDRRYYEARGLQAPDADSPQGKEAGRVDEDGEKTADGAAAQGPENMNDAAETGRHTDIFGRADRRDREQAGEAFDGSVAADGLTTADASWDAAREWTAGAHGEQADLCGAPGEHDASSASSTSNKPVDADGPRHSAEAVEGELVEPVKRRSAFRSVLDFLIVIAIACAVAFVVRQYVLEPFIVPSGSMEPTIEVGNRILSEKVSIDPQYGDIITFADPTDPSRTLIKRVIATEGQTVDLVDGKVVVDGVTLEEDYTYGKPSYPLSKTADGVEISYPYTVPEGCVWVMGDNRTDSADSRYFGAVEVSSISGEAIFTYWPLSEIGPLD